MLTDAHCHPADLLSRFPGAEEERRRLGIPCAASAWNQEQFELHEGLAQGAAAEGAPPALCCFAVHPQLPAAGAERRSGEIRRVLLPLLETLAREGRLDAVGETGFDLYTPAFRDTEAFQEEIFRVHLETALRYGLPLVLHVRRALHKIFAYTKELKRLPSVIFHSWPGTEAEGESLLRRGLNAYFSFGTVICLNHRAAQDSAARFPPERLLLETDAPWQPLRGKGNASWGDLPFIALTLAALRREAGSPAGDGEELEGVTAANFFHAFKRGAV
jgi:TatD DNase family protein